MRRQSYSLYLKSEHWKAKRTEAFKHYGDRCNRCGADGTQVHHRTYTRLGRELMSDLEVLCGTCHEEHHKEDIARKKEAKSLRRKKRPSKTQRRSKIVNCKYETRQEKQVACRQLAQWAGYKMDLLMDLERKELHRLMFKYAPKKYRQYLSG